jgi:hypothetical protein
MTDNKALIARMESAIDNYTNAIILIPLLALLSVELATIIQSTQGDKAAKKAAVIKRINQAIDNMIINMPALTTELNELKTTMTAAIK